MTGRDRDDEIERTRRLVTDLRGNSIDKRIEFDNLQNKQTTENPEGPSQQKSLTDEKITVETEIVKKGIYSDANGNEQKDIINTETKKITITGRDLIANLITGNSTDSLTTAKVGSGYKTPRRNAQSLDSVLKTSDTFSTAISNGDLVVTARFNDLDAETSDTQEVGLLTNNSTLLQYDIVDYNFVGQ